MNIERIEIGDLVFFLNVFKNNNGSVNSHHHNDLLSYVLYKGGEEVLIDPGQPSYLKPSDYSHGFRHNGLWSSEDYLRSANKFYYPRKLFRDAISLDIDKSKNSFSATARNRYTQAVRTFRVELAGKTTYVEETLRIPVKNDQQGFVHYFPNHGLKMQGERSIQFGRTKVNYSHKVLSVQSDRAVAYGEPDRAICVSSIHRVDEMKWNIDFADPKES